jgi:hypothetical protein
VPSCQSDKDCTAGGLTCDLESHTCKQCLVNADCPLSYHCDAGKCEHDACVPGASRCGAKLGSVEQCAAAGDRWLTLFCSNSQSCVSVLGEASCSNWLCSPATTSCSTDTRRVEVCAADGTTTLVAKECADDEVCTAGNCAKVLCAPMLQFCKGGVVNECSADGTVSNLKQTCGPGTHCDDASALCLANYCSPGTERCEGNQVQRCNADGSGYVLDHECGTGSVCAGGVCRALLCEPNARSCDPSGVVRQCNALGTQAPVVDSCGAGEHCYENGANAT